MKTGFAASVTLIGISVLVFPVAAETVQCANPLFRVTGTDPDDVEKTCEAADEAQRKLAMCGAVFDRKIDIEVNNNVTGEIGECLGIYHCGEDKIEIIGPSEIGTVRGRAGAFEQISDDVFWKSVVAHELTHAAYDSVECPYLSCIATSEYASFAMQVWTMPEDDQARFGSTIELMSEPTREAISETMLFLSPNHFALYAWLHFQSQPDPCGFMSDVLEGNVFFDADWP